MRSADDEKGTMPFDVNLLFPEAFATLARMDKSLRINSINSLRFASSIVNGPAEWRVVENGGHIMYRKELPTITDLELLIAIHWRAPYEERRRRVKSRIDEFWTSEGARCMGGR